MKKNWMTAVMCLLCILFLSACGDARKRTFKDISSRLDTIKYRSGFTDQAEGYQTILAELEELAGYPDADALAEEARAWLYQRVQDCLNGSSPDYAYQPSLHEYVTKIAGSIPDYQDIGDWLLLNEAAYRFTEGEAETAAAQIQSLPESFASLPLCIGIRIGACCTAGDWLGALEAMEVYEPLLTAASVKGTRSASSYDAARLTGLVLRNRMRTLITLLRSSGVEISVKEQTSSDEKEIQALFRSVKEDFLYRYHREAYLAGKDLTTLEKYPRLPDEKPYDFMTSQHAERTEKLKAALTEADLYNLYTTGTPKSNVEVSGNGFCVIVTDSKKETVLLNGGEVAAEIFREIPDLSAWADSVEDLRYVCRFSTKYTATHEVTTYNRTTGRTSKGYEYDIETTVVIYDTVTGAVKARFTYLVSEHNKTSTKKTVMDRDVLPALKALAASGG